MKKVIIRINPDTESKNMSPRVLDNSNVIVAIDRIDNTFKAVYPLTASCWRNAKPEELDMLEEMSRSCYLVVGGNKLTSICDVESLMVGGDAIDNLINFKFEVDESLSGK